MGLLIFLAYLTMGRAHAAERRFIQRHAATLASSGWVPVDLATVLRDTTGHGPQPPFPPK